MKKVMLLILLMLCVGCTIKYDLSISKDFTFNEQLLLFGRNESNLGTDDEFIKEYFDSIFSGVEGYQITENTSFNGDFKLGIKGEIKGVDFFLKSEGLNFFYNDNKVFVNDEGNHVFDLKRAEHIEEEAYTPLEFKDFEISITSEKKIVNSNADKIILNKYIWKMEDSNIKDIYFELSETNVFFTPFVITVTALVVVFVGIISFILLKSKKNNEI